MRPWFKTKKYQFTRQKQIKIHTPKSTLGSASRSRIVRILVPVLLKPNMNKTTSCKLRNNNCQMYFQTGEDTTLREKQQKRGLSVCMWEKERRVERDKLSLRAKAKFFLSEGCASRTETMGRAVPTSCRVLPSRLTSSLWCQAHSQHCFLPSQHAGLSIWITRLWSTLVNQTKPQTVKRKKEKEKEYNPQESACVLNQRKKQKKKFNNLTWPAQLTKYWHLICPLSVSTPVTRPFWIETWLTLVRSWIWTPEEDTRKSVYPQAFFLMCQAANVKHFKCLFSL